MRYQRSYCRMKLVMSVIFGDIKSTIGSIIAVLHLTIFLDLLFKPWKRFMAKTCQLLARWKKNKLNLNNNWVSKVKQSSTWKPFPKTLNVWQMVFYTESLRLLSFFIENIEYYFDEIMMLLKNFKWQTNCLRCNGQIFICNSRIVLFDNNS